LRQLNFADRLSTLVGERRSQIVLGLDPDPLRLLPQAAEAAGSGSAAERAARAVAEHCRALVAAAAPACVAVKLQLACFERLGAAGRVALGLAADSAHAAGLLVIADGKRGDVPHTAVAYGQSLVGETPTPWGSVAGLGADAVTANPLLGRDALEPLVDAARAGGAGVFVLVRSSNPGAAAIQDVDSGGVPWHERLAALVRELGAGGIGTAGLSDTGAVVAATEPDRLARLRELMPQAVFLLPGIGAQGGRVEDLRPAFAPGPAAALVTASRSLVDPALAAGDPSAAWAAAEALREAAWELAA
jgi:orotidine-5'-phosphate decarboxylase